ncbi:MAG TPA: L,D-transpeptidase family protein, partial [Devosia sp.]|nr:L,D-transpeptidase family protein [Devosia sp.]
MNRALGAFVLGLCAVGGLALTGLVWPLASGYLGAANRPQVQHISGASIDLGPLGQDLAAAGLALGDPAHLRLFKRERRLELWLQHGGARFAPFRSYPICAMSGGLGPKLAEGDRQAPEGFYRVSLRQLNPNSRHHLAFNLGYPNAYDLALGRTGSAIMVHGGCSSVGCFAMTDAGIDEIYG